MRLWCVNCATLFEVTGEFGPLEDDLSERKVTCPVCVEPCVIRTNFHSGDGHKLTAKQFWTASNGFGLPDEIVVGVDSVKAMLLSNKIISVDLRETETERAEVRNIELSNGVTLHFAASSGGAIIFKVTREKKDAG